MASVFEAEKAVTDEAVPDFAGYRASPITRDGRDGGLLLPLEREGD